MPKPITPPDNPMTPVKPEPAAGAPTKSGTLQMVKIVSAKYGAGNRQADVTEKLRSAFAKDPFAGNCPYHNDCLEGLASGSAITERWGAPAHDLPQHHSAWILEAHYLALALATWVCTVSPMRIVIGGGVMQRDFLFSMVRRELRELLNDYIPKRAMIEDLDDPRAPRAEKPTTLGWRSLRLRLSALAAGILIGVGAVAATPPVKRDQPVRANCKPTITRDASGVITADGRIGVVGETSTTSGDGSFLVLRRGAVPGEVANLQVHAARLCSALSRLAGLGGRTPR